MAAEHLVPTDAQRNVLCELIAAAFIEIRYLGGVGNATRAADLADVFHNLPLKMHGSTWWDPMHFRNDLEGYQRRYANDPDLTPRNFVAMFDDAFGEQLAPQIRIKQYLDALTPIRTGVWRNPDGAIGLLLQIVWSPPSPESQNNAPWFYGQYGRPDGSQWSIAARFHTLEESMDNLACTLGPGVSWNP